MDSIRFEKLCTQNEIANTVCKIRDVKESLELRVNLNDYFEKLAENAENYIMAFEENTVAFASMYANDLETRTAFITLIACTEGNRDKGYGGKLLDFCIKKARENGMMKLRLEVARSNDAAIAFYQKHGMNIVGTSEKGYFMEKKIYTFEDRLIEKYGEEYFKEEINCDFKVTRERKMLWATMLDLFEQFKAVCKKHNLRYFLFAGTLLGAVRHKGFIPWDDDIDVIMPREDYEVFLTLAGEFSHPYFLQTPYTDKNYCFSFVKLRNSETAFLSTKFIKENDNMNMGVFFDVFPLDVIVSGKCEETREKMQLLVRKCSTFMRKDGVFLEERDFNDLKTYYEPSQTAVKLYEDVQALAKSFKDDPSADKLSLITVTMSKPQNNLWEKEWYADAIEVPFENTTAMIPVGYDKILTVQFGDYMQFPPIEGRGGHSQFYSISMDYKEAIAKAIKGEIEP